MENKNNIPFWVVFGVGVVIVGAFGFVLASLGNVHEAATPVATRLAEMPVASPPPTDDSIDSPLSPLPVVEPTITPHSPPPTLSIEFAPDFTLEHGDGGTLTLSDQLAQGPVVLVFFQRCG
jgi:hypothetical protein